jgi:glycosyltransferase involved in cell wall biosynthesis
MFGLYLSKMWRLFYYGKQNQDFYVWAVGREQFNKKRVFFPCPHDHERFITAFTTAHRKDNHPFTILSASRLISWKRHDRLIEAIALLPKEIRSDIRCYIAGDGPERKSLIQKAKGLQVDHIMYFTGAISSDQMTDFFQQGDVFILLSDSEPWGLVLNEAFSMGIPVIAPYWVGAVPDLVVDGVTGMVLPDNNPETVAQAILRLYQLEDYGKHLGIEGQRRLKAMGFTMEKNIESFCKLVEELDAQQ